MSVPVYRHPERGEPGSDYQRGLDALAAKEYREALAIFERLVALDRTAPHLFHRGLAKYRSGDRPGARADFSAAIEIEPTYADAYWRRAIATDEPRAAIADHDLGIAIEPLHAKAYMERAGVWQRLGDLRRAQADFDRAAELDPADWMTFYNRSLLHLAQDRDALALADLDRVLELGPSSSQFDRDARYNRGLIHQRNRRLDAALAEYDAALAIDPRYAPALCNKGEVLMDLGRFEEARASALAALAIRPEFGRAKFIASLCEKDTDRKEPAEPAARAAAESRAAGLANTSPAGWKPEGSRSPLDEGAVAKRLAILGELADIVMGISTAESRSDAQEGVWRAFHALRPLLKEADLTAPAAGLVESAHLEKHTGRSVDPASPLFVIGGVEVRSPVALPFVVVAIHVKERQVVREGEALCRVGFVDVNGS